MRMPLGIWRLLKKNTASLFSAMSHIYIPKVDCIFKNRSIFKYRKFQAPKTKSDKIISYHIDVTININLIYFKLFLICENGDTFST